MSTLNKVVMALAVVAVSLGAGIGYTVVVSGSAAAQEQGPLELHWTFGTLCGVTLTFIIN